MSSLCLIYTIPSRSVQIDKVYLLQLIHFCLQYKIFLKVNQINNWFGLKMLTPGSSECEVGKLTLFLLQLELFWLLVLLNSYHPNRRSLLPWSYALFSCLLSPSLSKNSADDDHVDKEQEDSYNVDPLVSGFGQIYFTVKYI